MRNFVIFVFVLYLCQKATAYCCFRDPYMLPTTPCTNMCNPCKCYRDPANICNVCDTPSPICQCMSKCACDCPKYPIYFPEVEYPVTFLEIDPFYYRTCFCA